MIYSSLIEKQENQICGFNLVTISGFLPNNLKVE